MEQQAALRLLGIHPIDGHDVEGPQVLFPTSQAGPENLIKSQSCFGRGGRI
jgi:hypothetical protein